MGILGKLLPFRQTKIMVESVCRISDKQYIMATPEYREFVESIFVSANNSDGRDNFAFLLSIDC